LLPSSSDSERRAARLRRAGCRHRPRGSAGRTRGAWTEALILAPQGRPKPPRGRREQRAGVIVAGRLPSVSKNSLRLARPSAHALHARPGGRKVAPFPTWRGGSDAGRPYLVERVHVRVAAARKARPGTGGTGPSGPAGTGGTGGTGGSGPQGPTGGTGGTGGTGPSGPAGTTTVTVQTGASSTTSTADCGATSHATGGGWTGAQGQTGASFPSDGAGTPVAPGSTNPRYWTATASGGGSGSVVAYALCVPN
jgi:hypothetical protein